MTRDSTENHDRFLSNRLLQRLREQQVCLCLRVSMARTLEIAFVAEACGFDALYVDLEHSTLSAAEAAQICAAAAGLHTTALVRIASHDDPVAAKLLDAGALGIIAPHVESAAQAAQVVATCKFPPLGARSAAGPVFQNGYGRVPMSDFMERANAAVLVAVMLETADAVGHAEEIAAVEGVDMLMIGTADLCAQLGVAGHPDHPRVVKVYEDVAAICRARGKILGIGGIGDAALLSRYVALGARFISAGSDADFLFKGGQTRVRELRASVRGPSCG